ncbi:PREDICTED: uncharacterized protein LOC108759762 [Trachymyrmex cornetzi]|uniref:uncharacterized protein LOC108759762 n=1 Tax=Trachymyrmex cornetzi TaxID=471704 RepID=UPI00084F4B31|nr:PREDICTED: uncharacterized protein LOC108759762 [Trachymyrmex cornetzi]
MDKSTYIMNMTTILSDTDTYSCVKKDPVRTLTTTFRTLLTKWKKKGYIDDLTYKKLYCSDGRLSREYGVPKIHKPQVPLRIIVSSVGSPLHALATFLHKILFESIPRTESYLKNSFQLIDVLKNVHIDNNYSLVSLDVVSLFTNVPLDIALDCINEWWSSISRRCSLPREEFLSATQMILESTFFVFNNKTYRQCFGIPMGSPLSPIIADLVMRKLETWALSSIKNSPKFYYRYVDDVCMAVVPSDIDMILDKFNEFHPRLQFSVEKGGHLTPVLTKMVFTKTVLSVRVNVVMNSRFHHGNVMMELEFYRSLGIFILTQLRGSVPRQHRTSTEHSDLVSI